MITADPAPPRATAAPRRPTAGLVRWLWWAAVPFAAVYLILLAVQFGSVITSSSLDADAVSAPVIGQLFGAAPAHAHVVLGTFGWYSTLLFELATKWVPFHRQVWEAAPYAMALASAGLIAWSVYVIAGRVAASLTAAILICASPQAVRLLMSMTQHAPAWFCLAILGTFLVWLLRPSARERPSHPAVLGLLALLVGLVVGVNAASDPLVTVAGLVPFVLALGVALRLAPARNRTSLFTALAMLVVTVVSWAGTLALMSALNVAPEPGVATNSLASAAKVGSNFRLWWHSIAVLGNGDFFGNKISFTSALALVCAVLSIGAVVLLPRVGWRELRAPSPAADARAAARIAFLVFWCSSAILLSAAFVVSGYPGDLASYRYLLGLIYAAAAVIPVVAARRPMWQGAVLVGTCIFALAGVIGMAQKRAAHIPEQAPEPRVIPAVQRIAAREHLRIGYAGYWDATPITWGTHYRVQVYPVSVCDQGKHLCQFDLHYISSWYTPRAGIRSFLLTDRRTRLLLRPTPDLGRPDAVYRIGQATMYVYPYDVAQRLAPT
ncbi:MAG TPA: hypothetical protein VGY32_06885 [Solirubrobacteraceae bacterium]|nr:hypothetical protein [Solirubrobacteraceae bacterium]